MNGSEPGGIFQPSMQPVPSQPPVNSLHVPYPAAVTGAYSAAMDVTASSGGGGGSGFHQNININMHGGSEAMVKKRGRPRKYGPNGSMSPPAISAALAVNLTPVNAMAGSLDGALEQQQQPHSAAAPPISAAPVSSVPMEEGFASVKKARLGRPPGSLNKKQKEESVGSDRFGFIPHIIVVQPGEDVLNKIMSFSRNGPRAVCIISGIGVLNNVTLRQTTTSGGTATYEGRFDILSLSGSFVLSELNGQRIRTGGLSITLSGLDKSDRRVFGGAVAGLLTAASPVQVIVGSFLPENYKESLPANHVEPLSVIPKVTPANRGMGQSSSPSHGTLSESSGGPGSPLNRGNESGHQDMASMTWK